MARARVSFASPPPSDSGESPPASPLLPHDPVGATNQSDVKAISNNACAHLVVAPERLTVAEEALTSDRFTDIFLATLDEACHSPKPVTVRRFRKPFCLDFSSWEILEIAKFIQAWRDLKHDNLLGLLGYTLNHKNEIDLLISPRLINGNIRDFLSEVPMGAAERLGFVRDVTAGLDFLHGQRPPICHCNLDPILTDKRPFNQHEDEKQIYYSIVNRKAPGQLELILDLVSGDLKAEYASSLRLLHSYLPLCWDYEPRKRPQASLLRRQVFMFSFENDAGDSVVATLEELAHLLIPPERLRMVECSKLGAGNYGEVFFGILDEASSTPRHVAVKRLKAEGTRGERVRLAKRLARELNIWAKIKHPNIVELIGYYLDEKYESPQLISAHMNNGNVLDYIKSCEPDIERRIALVKGITAGLACLHDFNPAICHADLKPANVLVDLQMNAVLCDFGLASFVSGTDDMPGLATTTSLKGTPRYMSPELLLDSDCTHNLESDVWAWACTVFEVLTGRIPYAEFAGDVQFYLAIGQKKLPGDLTLLLPTDTEEVDSQATPTLRLLQSTLPQCWDFDPKNRPPICELASRLSDVSPRIGHKPGGKGDLASGDIEGREGLPGLSSQQQDSSSGNEDAPSRGSKDGMKVDEIPEDPSGSRAEAESAQGYKRNVPTETRSEGKGANNENPGTASAITRPADSEPQVGEDNPVTQIATDRSSLKIPFQPLSSLVWTAVLIISLSANIFFMLLRKVDPLPHQDAGRSTYQDRDL